jgi:hypothetical protein
MKFGPFNKESFFKLVISKRAFFMAIMIILRGVKKYALFVELTTRL